MLLETIFLEQRDVVNWRVRRKFPYALARYLNVVRSGCAPASNNVPSSG
jgi:hypothetical protein